MACRVACSLALAVSVTLPVATCTLGLLQSFPGAVPVQRLIGRDCRVHTCRQEQRVLPEGQVLCVEGAGDNASVSHSRSLGQG